MRAEKGFTIIELMIVLTVMAVLVAIAIPSFQSMIANNRLVANTNAFIGALSFARTEAVGRGTSIKVTSSAGNSWGSGLIIWQDADGDGSYDAGEELRVISSFKNTTIEGNFNEFEFSSSGLVNNADVFVVCDSRTGETGRDITLLGGGGVKVNTSSSCT